MQSTKANKNWLLLRNIYHQRHFSGPVSYRDFRATVPRVPWPLVWNVSRLLPLTRAPYEYLTRPPDDYLALHTIFRLRLPPRALLAALLLARDSWSPSFSPRIFEQKRDCSQSTQSSFPNEERMRDESKERPDLRGRLPTLFSLFPARVFAVCLPGKGQSGDSMKPSVVLSVVSEAIGKNYFLRPTWRKFPELISVWTGYCALSDKYYTPLTGINTSKKALSRVVKAVLKMFLGGGLCSLSSLSW